MKNPLITVVVPTFERKERLTRALQSLLSQTYHNLEIIVVDDNKDAEYRKKVKEIQKSFKSFVNIKFIYNEKNLGGALARNVGIQNSTGEYITFLDDDDIYLSNKVKSQYNQMYDLGVDVSLANLIIKDEKGNILEVRSHQDLSSLNQTELLLVHYKYHLTGTPTFMFKANKLKQIGGFDNSEISQEFYLMDKVIKNDLKVAYINDTEVIAYRSSVGGITTSDAKVRGEKALLDFKKKNNPGFSNSDMRYIVTRSNIAIGIAYTRRKNILKGMYYLMIAFISSPVAFVKIGKIHLKKEDTNNER